MSIGETIVARLKEAFPDVRLKLEDTRGTGDYWTLDIASDAFTGLSRVKKHQAVYAPLRDLLDANHIHALKIQTYSLAEWAEKEKG